MQTTSANKRPVDIGLEVRKNMDLCLAGKHSLIDVAITKHLHYVAILIDCKSDYQLIAVAKELASRMEQELRNEIHAS